MGIKGMRIGSGEGFNEKLYVLYCSPSIFMVIKSKSLRWAGHEARMQERRNAFKMLTGKSTGERPLEKLGIEFIWFLIGILR